MHMDELKHDDGRLVRDSNLLQKIHSETFSSWLQNKFVRSIILKNSLIHIIYVPFLLFY